MLVKKQNITSNNQWLEAFEKSTEIYSFEDIQNLEKEAIERIQLVAKNYKNICSGWIAGKDSLVLDNILQKSGIKYTPIMWRGINEYPAVRDWIDEHKPKNLIEETIDKYTLEFIEKHPSYLFCKKESRQQWMATKWKRQKADIEKYKFDLFIAGRRLKDGNQCGSPKNNFIVDNKTYKTFSPLGDWNAEQLLAYIKYYNIDLSPFYKWDRGFLIGSIAMGEWTERAIMNMTENDVWEELYQIDKNIVIEASKVLTSAKNFLIKKGN